MLQSLLSLAVAFGTFGLRGGYSSNVVFSRGRRGGATPNPSKGAFGKAIREKSERNKPKRFALHGHKVRYHFDPSPAVCHKPKFVKPTEFAQRLTDII